MKAVDTDKRMKIETIGFTIKLIVVVINTVVLWANNVFAPPYTFILV
jgi:hypothetical protein